MRYELHMRAAGLYIDQCWSNSVRPACSHSTGSRGSNSRAPHAGLSSVDCSKEWTTSCGPHDCRRAGWGIYRANRIVSDNLSDDFRMTNRIYKFENSQCEAQIVLYDSLHNAIIGLLYTLLTQLYLDASLDRSGISEPANPSLPNCRIRNICCWF